MHLRTNKQNKVDARLHKIVRYVKVDSTFFMICIKGTAHFFNPIIQNKNNISGIFGQDLSFTFYHSILYIHWKQLHELCFLFIEIIPSTWQLLPYCRNYCIFFNFINLFSLIYRPSLWRVISPRIEHVGPTNPGTQWHLPVTWSQVPPFSQLHCFEQNIP
jgi:hypothetical protein